MIVTTKDMSALLRSALPRSEASKVSFWRIDNILEMIQLDPAIKGTRVDAFVISSADIRRGDYENFTEALKLKHKDAVVIYVRKSRKADMFCDNRYINKYLINPRGQELVEAIHEWSTNLSEKPVIISSADSASNLSPKDVKVDQSYILGDDYGVEERDERQEIDLTSFDEEELPVNNNDFKIEETAEKVKGSELADRIKNVDSIAGIMNTMLEVNSENILKELAKENANFSIIETKLQALKEEVNVIMLDSKLNMESRLQKVRSIMYDKKYFSTGKSTIIEQYVSDIVESLTSKTVDLINERLSQIEESIKLSTRFGGGTQNFGRITGINEERASTIMELSTMQVEVQTIATKIADTLHILTAEVASSNQEMTGNPLLDNDIKAHGTFIVDGESIETLRKILQTADRSTDEFKELSHKVTSMLATYNKIINLDKEQNAAMAEIVKYLQAKNIEDTVVANKLLKRALRVFTGAEGSGRSILPYMLSKRKSRCDYNVLLVDLTGTCKYDDYGIKYYTLEDYKENRYEKDFAVVSGVCETAASAQNLSVILTKAADHYRVINIVLDPCNSEVFDILSQDVLCINYLSNTKKRNMEVIRSLMFTQNYDNVAKRVIVNDSSVNLTELAKYFNLLDRLDCQLLSVPHIPQVEVCSLKGLDPLSIECVSEQLVEVCMYA